MPRHLIVAATSEEAAYVPDGLPVVVTGVGKTAGAAATARALAELASVEDLHVVNIGTAGALRDGVTGLHHPSVVLNHEISADALRTLGYDPRERLEVGIPALGAAEDGPVLATGDVFVTDPVVRNRLADVAQLVDMEGYAVAFAAQQFGVPVHLVKYVSDNADEGAYEWPELVDACARVLGTWLEENLPS